MLVYIWAWSLHIINLYCLLCAQIFKKAAPAPTPLPTWLLRVEISIMYARVHVCVCLSESQTSCESNSVWLGRLYCLLISNTIHFTPNNTKKTRRIKKAFVCEKYWKKNLHLHSSHKQHKHAKVHTHTCIPTATDYQQG